MGNCQNASVDDGHKTITKEKRRADSLIVNTMTWERDSHGLFDYESENNTKGLFKIVQSAHFYRHSQTVIMKGDDEVRENETEIFKISTENSKFWVQPLNPKPRNAPPKPDKKGGAQPEPDTSDGAPWIVVKSLKKTQAFPRGYKIKEGDYIKLGRVRFRVREMKLENVETNTNNGQSRKSVKKQQPKLELHQAAVNQEQPKREPSGKNLDESINSRNTPTCRVCLDTMGENDNPVVSPCQCAGSMKYIHIKCLQEWLRSRLQTKQTAVSLTVVWKSLDCEICKKTFPKIIEVDGIRYSTLELPKANSASYIILEVLSKDKSQIRGLHIINMSVKQQIKMGRGHDSDVRVSDISVSRCHAIISADKNGAYILDNDSKFGTLVQLKKPIQLRQELSSLQIQVGRTVFALQMTVGGPRVGGASCMQLEAGGQPPSDLNDANPNNEGEIELNQGNSNSDGEEEGNVWIYSPQNEPQEPAEEWNVIPGSNASPVNRAGANRVGGPTEPIMNIDDFLYNHNINSPDNGDAGVHGAQPPAMDDDLPADEANPL